jgi:hypothetical protein
VLRPPPGFRTNDKSQGASDLAGDKRFPANGRFVIEQDSVTGEKPVGFAIVHCNPVAIDLGHPIGRTVIKKISLFAGDKKKF